jgi:hypothetical protein
MAGMTTQHKPTELKPCPFCGGDARAMGKNSGFIYCAAECGGEVRAKEDGFNAYSDEAAARAWNTRAMQSASPAPSEDVVELLQLRLTEDKRRLEARLCETQMLLVSCGNHDALAEKAKTWPEVKRAFADRCLECGGLHGPSSGCMGPPMPSVPHPHAGKMQG